MRMIAGGKVGPRFRPEEGVGGGMAKFYGMMGDEKLLNLTLKPAATKLNGVLEVENPYVYSLLSERGGAISFPHSGILGQSKEARDAKVRINATIGTAVLDDGSPMRLQCVIDAIKNVLEKPADTFNYAPSQGRPDLRSAWKKLLLKKNPTLIGKAISNPVVTIALTHGGVIAGYMFANPGDEITVANKYWGNYGIMFENNFGAKLKPINTFKGEGMDLGALRSALMSEGGKKIVLFNFPNNPTGYTPTVEEAHMIAAILKEAAEAGKRIVAIFDDAYFGLVYKPGVFTESVFALAADLHENILAVKLDGATKEDYAWGFRIGFITFAFKGMQSSGDVMNPKGAEVLEDKAAGAVRGSVSNASNMFQAALAMAYTSPDYWAQKEEMGNILQERFETVEEVFEKHGERYSKYFVKLPTNSGYFMCVDLAQGLVANDIRKKLLQPEYSVGVISDGTMLRTAFSATPKAVIPELFELMYKACEEVAGKK